MRIFSSLHIHRASEIHFFGTPDAFMKSLLKSVFKEAIGQFGARAATSWHRTNVLRLATSG
jgi:hypothetical protein